MFDKNDTSLEPSVKKILRTRANNINNGNSLYLNEYNILYCPITKTGSTTMTNWLQELTDRNPFDLGIVNVNFILLSYLKLAIIDHLLLSLGREDLRRDAFKQPSYEELEEKEPFRFTMVRNPFDRLVSGYVHKFGRSNVTEKDSMKQNDWKARVQVLTAIKNMTEEE